MAEPHYQRCLFLGFCFPTSLSMMAPHPQSSSPHSSQLAEGRIGRTFLLTSHWPDLVIWQHSVVRKAGKCSLYFGQRVPRVLFFKEKRIVLRENWQSATIPYHMRIAVWFIFPQQEAADTPPLPSPALFLLHFSQQKRILMHSERCEVS